MPTDSNTFSRTLLSRAQDVTALADSVQEWAKSCGLPDRSCHYLGLLLDELIANIVHHAYQGRDDGRIQIRIRIDGTQVCVTLRDTGPPFDPTRWAPADTTQAMDEREFGGLGIHFVRRIAEHFSYRRDGDVNEVVFCLPSTTPSKEPTS
jgi:serine/threonine-protein kinase RsbW